MRLNYKNGSSWALLLIVVLIAGLVLVTPAHSQSETVSVSVCIKDYMLRPVFNASVYIDDQFIGYTDASGIVTTSGFNAGLHNITASAPGLTGRTAERTFSDGNTVNVQLNRDLTVTDPNIVTFIALDNGPALSKLAGAAIIVDGKEIGKTDTRNGHLQAIVEPGPHRVIVYKEGWVNNTTSLNITAGSEYTILLQVGKKFSILDGKLFLYTLPKLVFNGLVMTLQLSLIAMALGITIGLIMGLGRTSDNIFIRSMASIYVEGVRGLPLLLQLLFVNFGLPFLIQDLTGGTFNINAFTACVIALSVNSGAYMAEIFKAGIEAIHKGQMEAARSLGMSHGQSMRYIILPQAFKIVLPALGNEFIALIKDSSIGLVISVSEVLWWSKTIGAEYYNTFTPLLAAGLVYLCITIPLGRAVQYLEKKYNVNARKNNLPGKKKKLGGKPEVPV
jgi:polar amino acid transport system permease protein